MNAVLKYVKHLKPEARSKIILILQIVVFFILYALLLLFLRNNIPDTLDMAGKIDILYERYGDYLVFLGALLEGTFVVGFYVPGSWIVLYGATLAHKGILSFPLVVLYGTLGLLCGYVVNYCLGRFGWYRILEGFGYAQKMSDIKGKLKQYENKALFFGYLMPSTGSLLSTTAGMMRIPFGRFFFKSMVIQLFWSLLLGGLAYIFGWVFIQIFLIYFGFIALGGFIFYVIKKLRKHRKK